MGITVTYKHKKPDPKKCRKRIKKLKARIEGLRVIISELETSSGLRLDTRLTDYEASILDTIIFRAEHKPLDGFTEGDLEELKRKIAGAQNAC